MRQGILIAGILILIFTFMGHLVLLEQQQYYQLKAADTLCNSAIGAIGVVMSPDVAQKCQMISNLNAIFGFIPILYLIGAILVVAGALMSATKEEQSSKQHLNKCDICGATNSQKYIDFSDGSTLCTECDKKVGEKWAKKHSTPKKEQTPVHETKIRERCNYCNSEESKTFWDYKDGTILCDTCYEKIGDDWEDRKHGSAILMWTKRYL